MRFLLLLKMEVCSRCVLVVIEELVEDEKELFHDGSIENVGKMKLLVVSLGMTVVEVLILILALERDLYALFELLRPSFLVQNPLFTLTFI